MADPDARQAVVSCGEAARQAAPDLAAAPGAVIDGALRQMASLLTETAAAILEANEADMARGAGQGLGRGLLDRLRLDEQRLAATARQLELLAGVAFPAEATPLGTLPDGLRLEERRVPIGVVGANFEARPAVTVDIASQLLKSRNAGVLRTGAAALASAAALFDHAISPALEKAGLSPRALQLVRTADRAAAAELVRQPGLIPLVILRGSGESTRSLAADAARHGVRTLAHADGGGVLYLDRAAEPAEATRLITESLDRLGVCNRLNLLLICSGRWDELLPAALGALAAAGVAASLPPHDHPLGREWALQAGREATVTIAPVPDAAAAAQTANDGDLRARGRHRHRGSRRGAAVSRRLPGDRRVLEREHETAGRLQAPRRARDGHQRRSRARAARPGHLRRSLPAAVRGHARVTGRQANQVTSPEPLARLLALVL